MLEINRLLDGLSYKLRGSNLVGSAIDDKCGGLEHLKDLVGEHKYQLALENALATIS
jgi:hypothetical protein